MSDKTNTELQTEIMSLEQRIVELEASQKQLEAANQQLQPHGKLTAHEQQLRASNQQLEASNQQLGATEQQLRASNQQLRANAQALTESENRYRTLCEAAQDNIFIVSEGRISYVNAAGARFFGRSVNQMVGQPLEELFPPDALRHQRATISRVLATGLPENASLRLPLPGGERWLDTTLVRLSDAAGKQSVMGISRDVSDKILAEQHHSAVLSAALDGYWLVDAQGWFLDVNDSYLTMTGYSREEFLSMNIADLEIAESAEETAAHLEIVMTTGGDRFETRHRRKDGTVMDAEVSVTFLALDGGRMVVFVRDITIRIQAEQELRRSEHIVSSSTDMLALLDRDYVYRAANSEYVSAFNRRKDELLGRTVAQVFGEEFFADVIKPHADRCLAGETIRYREWFDFPAYEPRWMEITYSPYFDDQDHVAGFTVNGRDLTDYRKAQSALSLKNQVFEDSITALSIADVNGIITEVNPAFLTLWGYGSKEDAIGGSVGSFFANEADAGPVLEALGTSGRWEGDFLAHRADGATFVSQALATAMKNERGELIGYQSANLDVTEQRHAESEAKLRNQIANIFLSVPDDEMYAEVLKVVLDVAQSEFGVFGYIDESGALVVPSMTRHIWDECEVPEKDIVFPRDEWGDSIWPRAVRRKELLFSNSPSDLAPQGHIQIARNIAAPIVHQGDVVGLFHIANKASDYTPDDIRLIETLRDMVAPILGARLARDRQERDRRRREAEIITLNSELDQRVVARTLELTAANEELEAFAYSVSHDLRAPLRGIDGFAQALVEDYGEKLDDTGKDYINRVRAGTQRMGRLIDDLLKLSRLTRAEMHHQGIDLGELARKIAAELQRDEPERSVDFEVAAGLTARGDRALLEAAFENLLRNAWKFTGQREHARIELGVGEHAGERAYYVRDNGAGFDMAYIDKLFGPFQRLHDTAEFPGNGIGLAIVQRVVFRHGGRVWAEGEVDKGATVYFTLPTKTANADEGADS